MRDCSTTIVAPYVHCLKQLGAPVDRLVDGLSVDLATLERPHNWLDWETVAEVLERMETRMGRRDIWSLLADDWVERRTMSPVMRLALSPHRLFRIAACRLGPRAMPIHDVRWCTSDARRVRIVLALPRYRVGSESFFRGAHALFVDLPRVIGLPRAHVESTIGPHHGYFDIHVPTSMTLAARTQRAVRALVTGSVPGTESPPRRALSIGARAQPRALLSTAEPTAGPSGDHATPARQVGAMSRLAGGVAHDLNNLLMSISGYADLVRDELTEEGTDGHRLLDELGRAVDRGSVLAMQLLAFSQRDHLRPRNVDVNQVMESQLRLLRRLLSGLTVRLELAPQLEAVHIDPGQLKQVLANLAVNAREAMPRGGTVSFETKAITGEDGRSVVRISVHDEGPGLPPDAWDRISTARAHSIEPFVSSTGSAATGLALATVQAVVAEMGGWVGVRSVAGQGTTFDVDLPTIVGPAEPVAGRPVTEEGPPSGSETVLLVEDEEMLRRILSAALQRAGYDVVVARGLADATEVCRVRDRLDLVISDVMLGPDRGTDVVGEVLRHHPGARCLLISGAVDPDQDPLVRPHPFLKKPFSNAELLLRVRQLLDAPDTADA